MTGLGQAINGLATSGVLGCLGLFSVFSGCRQRSQLTRQIKLNEEKIKINEEKINNASNSSLDFVSGAQNKVLCDKQEFLKKTQKYLNHRKSELLWGMVAGSLMTFKGFAELGTQIVLGGKSVLSGKSFMAFGDLAQVGLAVGAASVVGLGGVFATPLIGAASDVFAFKAWRKSRELKAESKINFSKAFENFKVLPSTSGVDTNVESASALQQFMCERNRENNTKLKSARTFNRSLFGWSTLFTATALTKALVVALALGGIAFLASNPVGWGVLVGATVALGAVMAYYALRAHFANKQQDKLLAFETQEHHLVNKDLIARQALISTQGVANHSQSSISVANATFQHLDNREKSLRDFLGLELDQKIKANLGKVGCLLTNNENGFRNFVLQDIEKRKNVLDASLRAVRVPSDLNSGSLASQLAETENSLTAEIQGLDKLTELLGRKNNESVYTLRGVNLFREGLRYFEPSLNVDVMDDGLVRRKLVQYLSGQMGRDLKFAKAIWHAGVIQAYKNDVLKANGAATAASVAITSPPPSVSPSRLHRNNSLKPMSTH